MVGVEHACEIQMSMILSHSTLFDISGRTFKLGTHNKIFKYQKHEKWLIEFRDITSQLDPY